MFTKRNAKITTHTFLVTIELEDKVVDPERVALRLADGPQFMDGVGAIDVQYQGKLEQYGDKDPWAGPNWVGKRLDE